MVTNGTHIIRPPEGYEGFEKATVEVNVPVPNVELSKTQTITTNTTTTIEPSINYDAMQKVIVTTNVQPDTETLEVFNYGTYTPSTGSYYSEVYVYRDQDYILYFDNVTQNQLSNLTTSRKSFIKSKTFNSNDRLPYATYFYVYLK